MGYCLGYIGGGQRPGGGPGGQRGPSGPGGQMRQRDGGGPGGPGGPGGQRGPGGPGGSGTDAASTRPITAEGAAAHMASFDVIYRIDAFREWLFTQKKD